MFANIYRGKKILVTGHTGFKGSWLSLWLSMLGAEVCGYSLYVPSEPSHAEVIGLEKLVYNSIGDVRDYGELQRICEDFKPEIVFHLAAQPIVSQSYHDPKLTFETNILGMVNILEIIRHVPSIEVGVLITSDKCYENIEWIYGYREVDRLGGKDPYSASKAAAELVFKSYFNSFFKNGSKNIFTARAGNVIGGGDWALGRIIPDCIRAWFAKNEAVLRQPEATRPWQHVLEPLSGYLWLGAQPFLGEIGKKINGESYNFGPHFGEIHAVADIVASMAKIWGDARWDIACSPETKGKEAGLLRLDCTKALVDLAWKACLTFDETVAFTAYWYDSYYNRAVNSQELSVGQIEQYVNKASEMGLAWTVG